MKEKSIVVGVVGIASLALVAYLLWPGARTTSIPTSNVTVNSPDPGVPAEPDKSEPQPASQPAAPTPQAPLIDADVPVGELIEAFIALAEAGNAPAARTAFEVLEVRGEPAREAAHALFYDEAGAPRAEGKQDFVRNMCLLSLMREQGAHGVLVLVLARWTALDKSSERMLGWATLEKRPLEVLAADALPNRDRALVDAAGAAVEYRDGIQLGATRELLELMEGWIRQEAPDRPIAEPILSHILHRFTDAKAGRPERLEAMTPLLRTVRSSEHLALRLRVQAAKLLVEPPADILELADQLRSALAKDDATQMLSEYLRTRPIPTVEDWELLMAALFSRWHRADVWWILNDLSISARGALFDDSTKGEELAEVLTSAALADGSSTQKLASIGAIASLLSARRGAKSRSGKSLAAYDLMRRTTSTAEALATEILDLLASHAQGKITDDQFTKLLKDAGSIFLELPLSMPRRLELVGRLPARGRSAAERLLVLSAIFGALGRRPTEDLVAGGQVLMEGLQNWGRAFLDNVAAGGQAPDVMQLHIVIAGIKTCLIALDFPGLTSPLSTTLATLMSLAQSAVATADSKSPPNPKTPLGMLKHLSEEFQMLLRQEYPGQFDNQTKE